MYVFFYYTIITNKYGSNKKKCLLFLGFIICKHKLENKHLSEFTKQHLVSNSSSECVVGVHHTKNLLYMHTSYFLWLKNVFGFEDIPDIVHFVAYRHAPYLKTPIERYLKKRFEIKKKMLQNANVSLKIQSEIIKLLMNRLVLESKI